MERAFAVGVGSLAAVWLALSVTPQGVLVGSWRHRYTPAGQEVLTCSYLSGGGVMTVDYWYSPTGHRGQSACPWLHDLHGDFSRPSFGYRAGTG